MLTFARVESRRMEAGARDIIGDIGDHRTAVYCNDLEGRFRL